MRVSRKLKNKTPIDYSARPPAFLDMIYGHYLMMADGDEIITGALRAASNL